MRIRLQFLIPRPGGSYFGYGTRPEVYRFPISSERAEQLIPRLAQEVVIEVPEEDVTDLGYENGNGRP